MRGRKPGQTAQICIKSKREMENQGRSLLHRCCFQPCPGVKVPFRTTSSCSLWCSLQLFFTGSTTAAGGCSESYHVPAAGVVVSGAPGSLCFRSEIHPSLHFTEQYNRVLHQLFVDSPMFKALLCLEESCVFKKTLLVGISAFTHSTLAQGFQKSQTHNIHELWF